MTDSVLPVAAARGGFRQPEGILSIPLGFIGCWLGTVRSKGEAKAECGFGEPYVRSETALGAEAAGSGVLRPRGGRATAAITRHVHA